MKITLDQDTLAAAVINHLRAVGVKSDILQVEFRYTRVPYTVFAEVELAEAPVHKPHKAVPEEVAPPPEPEESPAPLVDPSTLPFEEPTEPPPDAPAAPLFGSN